MFEEDQAVTLQTQQRSGDEQDVTLQTQQRSEEEKDVTLQTQQRSEEEQNMTLQTQQRSEEELAMTLQTQQRSEEEKDVTLQTQQRSDEDQDMTLQTQQRSEEEMAMTLQTQQRYEEEKDVTLQTQQRSEEEQDVTLQTQQRSGEEQDVTLHTRQLSEEERKKLEQDKKLVSEFKQMKFEKDAQKNWDIFYKRNTTKFYKDRHWTTREFQELCGQKNSLQKLVVLEVGCGVGNFLFPLLEENEEIFFYACDFSPRAVSFVMENPLYDEDRCKAFQCDLTRDALSENVPADGVDIVTMIFVLSAIHPNKMPHVLTNLYTVLKPGGCVLLRDYGIYDHAMLRFAPGHKLAEHFYVRQDGTRAYYFSLDVLSKLFIDAHFQVEKSEYIQRETVNKKEGLCVPRVFVQGKFVKPKSEDDSCSTTLL